MVLASSHEPAQTFTESIRVSGSRPVPRVRGSQASGNRLRVVLGKLSVQCCSEWGGFSPGDLVKNLSDISEKASRSSSNVPVSVIGDGNQDNIRISHVASDHPLQSFFLPTRVAILCLERVRNEGRHAAFWVSQSRLQLPEIRLAGSGTCGFFKVLVV